MRNDKLFRLTLPVTAICLLNSIHATRAQSLTYVGAQLNLADGWRNPAVPKTYDLNNDGIYGTDGYILYNTSPAGSTGGGGFATTLTSQPSYLTIQTNATGGASKFGYAQINNPVPGGTFSGDIEGGLASSTALPLGQYATLVTLTMGASVPNIIRIGYFLDAAEYDLPASLQISGPNGISASVATTTIGNPTEADYYFFDVQGAQSGQVFTVSAERKDIGNTRATIGGLTFDSVGPYAAVPEANTGVMLSVGLLLTAGFSVSRRRKTS